MKSKYAEEYNHDAWADLYDRSVTDESDPIRTGYRNALTWIGNSTTECSLVLDLGTGTGNTIAVLPKKVHVVAVDISKKMLEIAKEKLIGRPIEFIQSDLLEYLEKSPISPFDGIVSSYTCHHLTESEKAWMLGRIKSLMQKGGVTAIVDLMYKDANHRAELIEKYKQADSDTAESVEEELYWDIQKTRRLLEQMDISYTMERFSELSWGILLTHRV